MLAFLISALATGFVVVFVLPFAKTQLDRIPGLAGLTGNRLVQLIIVGAIVLLGMGLLGQVTKRLRI